MKLSKFAKIYIYTYTRIPYIFVTFIILIVDVKMPIKNLKKCEDFSISEEIIKNYTNGN